MPQDADKDRRDACQGKARGGRGGPSAIAVVLFVLPVALGAGFWFAQSRELSILCFVLAYGVFGAAIVAAVLIWLQVRRCDDGTGPRD